MTVTDSPMAIEIESLSKTYARRGQASITAVEPLHLSIARGQIFGFLGANGAGKTTTIKMICGLIMPTTGQVRVNGYNVLRERSEAMRQIGAVLEGTRNVYWRMSAWDNLLYFGRLKGYWGKELHQRAERLLRDLELWDRRKDSVRLFSRGMQQKVAIACSLIADPPIILLDEPTLGLDVQASRTVKEWITTLARERGKTIILTTHQLDIAQELCDRVAIMSKGTLLTDKPLPELLSLFKHEYYQFRVKGLIENEQLERFDALHIEVEHDETVLSGEIANQASLYDYLARVRDLGLPLLAVTRMEPDLEDIFVRLVDGQKTLEKKGEGYADHALSHVQ